MYGSWEFNLKIKNQSHTFKKSEKNNIDGNYVINLDEREQS